MARQHTALFRVHHPMSRHLISGRRSTEPTCLTGPAAEALYGGAVPITFGNNFHIGNSPPRPGDDAFLVPDLMNGVVFYRGMSYGISPLDRGDPVRCGRCRDGTSRRRFQR